MDDAKYDPFARGPFPVGVRTIQAADQARGRVFPCEIWYPARSEDADRSAGQDSGRDAAARPGAHPLIVFSHYSGGHRRSATFLSTHLASHGHVVGLVGHSFGGWTVLATPDVEPRVRAVAAFGPGGNAHPKPGILPLTLNFAWSRVVPTLYLAAADDVPIPLTGVYELFDRTPTPQAHVRPAASRPPAFRRRCRGRARGGAGHVGPWSGRLDLGGDAADHRAEQW